MTRIVKEGKRGDQAGICASGKSQKKREFTQVEICPGEWRVQATYWVPQSWDPTQRRGARWLIGGLMGLAGKPAPHSWRAHENWLAPEVGQASLVAQLLKSLPAMWETQVHALGGEDPLGKERATHFSILAWRIPWTEEPGWATIHEITKSLTPEWLALWHFQVGQRGAGWILLKQLL